MHMLAGDPFEAMRRLCRGPSSGGAGGTGLGIVNLNL
jgi:hypothetical protein